MTPISVPCFVNPPGISSIAMTKRLALAMTTTTPGFPGGLGLRVTG